MDVVTFAVFFIFGLYLAGRLYFKRVKAVSNVPWWVGDPVHGAVGAFVTRLPVEWAWLISVLYVTYQLLDWKVNGSDPVKDIGVYMGGMIIGFGYDMVKF
jgi:hypothetical protein